MHKDPISGSLLAQALGSCLTSSPSKGDDVTKCSGAESSNTNFSFPEHFEGKRQSGEKDCLPLLSTFCKFQRLKVKGSQVMLVCLHEHTVAHEWSDVTDVNVCKLFMFRDSTLLWQPLHAFVCDCSSAPMVWHWVLASHCSPSKGDDVTKCSGAESSNTNFSFPEHFEGKRQSGEKDCLPLLSTFCKFQRLKVKGSQVMLVCLHEHTVAHEWSDVTDVNVCKLFMFRDSTLLWQPLHAFVCDCSSAPMVWSGIVSTYLIARSDRTIAPIVVR